MSDIPKFVHIYEQGPREGFQIESALIKTEDKVRFIDALSETGVQKIQITSFVSPKWVPQMADADEVCERFTPKPGVKYTALTLNEKGRERMQKWAHKLTIEDEARSLVWATDEFSLRNNNRTRQELLSWIPERAQKAKEEGATKATIGAGAAFGCNFHGEVPLEDLLWVLEQQYIIWTEAGLPVKGLSLADTMGWAMPWQIKRTLGAIREKWPEITEISLHLHDTRGMGIANFMAGLEMGVSHFDACCGGLGGCPYSGNGQAAGNVCTEDMVFLCQEMGIETGIDLDKMIECAKIAEKIVGHVLPGHLYKALGLPRKGTKLYELYNAQKLGAKA